MLNNAVSGPWGKSSSVDTVTNVTHVLLQKMIWLLGFLYLAVQDLMHKDAVLSSFLRNRVFR